MAEKISTGSGTTSAIEDNSSEIIEQRRASSRYFTNNYWEEFAESYRTMKARTVPFTRRNDKGEDVEDESRTNICLPDHHVMVRHGVARLTRNPPNLRLRGANPEAAQKAALQLMYQWDRSKSQKQLRKIVHSGKAFGWGVGKSYYDKIQLMRKFRRAVGKMTQADLMMLQGAEPDDIPDGADQQPLSESEQGQAASEFGNSPAVPQLVTRYEGAALDAVFIGDFYPEPGFQSLPESAYAIENAIRDDEWLDYWTNQTSTDPNTGEESPVITEEVAAKIMEISGSRNYIDQKEISLRRMMRMEIGISDPSTAGKPIRAPKKRFMIDERHSIVNGHLCIEFVAEESIFAGRLWYPWDTYGRYLYSDLVLIPDLIEGIGDSGVRITRFLMQMRNTRMNQVTDAINNRLNPMMKALEGDNWTDQDLVRTGWARILTVRDMNEIAPLEEPEFPPEAFEDTAQLIREMQQVAPEMQDFSPGTDAVPQAGKLATTAVLQSRSADAITADELNCLSSFIHDVMEINLALNQQAMEESLTIGPGQGKRTDQMLKAISSRTEGGNPREITIDPMDIQEEFEIIPEEGSTLADDDEFVIGKIQQAFMAAVQNPDVFNKRYIGQELISRVPGLDPEKAMAPPPSAPPPPPPKVAISIQAKLEDQAPDVKTWVLESIGAPHEGTAVLSTIKSGADAIEHVSRAANHAADLERPADAAPGGTEGASGNAPQSTAGIRNPKGLGGSKG